MKRKHFFFNDLTGCMIVWSVYKKQAGEVFYLILYFEETTLD
jgi:hypothetical protein